eukprot:7061238-Pyramimonas_sp.AAC.1
MLALVVVEVKVQSVVALVMVEKSFCIDPRNHADHLGFPAMTFVRRGAVLDLVERSPSCDDMSSSDRHT